MNLKKLLAGVLACCVMGIISPVVEIFSDNTDITAYANEYTLEMIKDDPDAFNYFAGCLNWDILQGYGISCSYADVTFGGRESRVALAIMNDGEISGSVLQQIFADYSKEELIHGTEYIYSIRAKQMIAGTDVDYSIYVYDQEIAEFLNKMDNVYRSGNIDAFIREKFIDGNNISEKCLYHLGIMSIGCSYDENNIALPRIFVDEFVMNEYIDNLYEKVHSDITITKGDVNNDGAVDADDASLVLAEYARQQTGQPYSFTETQLKAADYNADGAIDSDDASLILAYYAAISTGKDTE